MGGTLLLCCCSTCYVAHHTHFIIRFREIKQQQKYPLNPNKSSTTLPQAGACISYKLSLKETSNQKITRKTYSNLLAIYLVINFLVWNVHLHMPFVLCWKPCIWHLVCLGSIVYEYGEIEVLKITWQDKLQSWSFPLSLSASYFANMYLFGCSTVDLFFHVVSCEVMGISLLLPKLPTIFGTSQNEE